MTPQEYMRRKNVILFKHTGITLVPELQIDEDFEFTGELSIQNDCSACPYCMVFYAPLLLCDGCPMATSNNCITDDHASYKAITISGMSITHKESPWFNELSELITEFNKETTCNI